MRAFRLNLLVAGVTLAMVAACTSAGTADTPTSSATTFNTVGDSVIASTTGNVAEADVRHLAVDWRVSTDTGTDVIGDVRSIAVDGSGQVWAWDNSTPALWLVAADGASIRRVGRAGSGPGEYQDVNGIAVAKDGTLVMWDDGNSRLNFYSRDGVPRANAALTFSDCCGLPVSTDTLNRIWLTTRPRMIRSDLSAVDPRAMIKNEIGFLRYDASGTLIDTVMAPTLPGRDAPVSALQVTSTDFGGAIRQVPYATYPYHAVSPFGHVISAMARPYAIYAEANGKHVKMTREFAPPIVTEEERAQIRANIEFIMRRENRGFRWNGPEVPREKPPITGIMAGLDGRVWVQLSVPSEASDVEPTSALSKNRPPPVNFRPTEQRWDVFEPDGRYVGRVAAPLGVDVFVTRGNQGWGVMHDANDVAAIVRLRIEPGR
ncbi:MAG: 6-bladed beta-propeller [Gemmatimonadaceae bacterium]